MEKLFFAQKAFIVKNNQLLIIQKSIDAHFCAGMWEVPGGRMEPNESVEQHLAREVFEEVGISVNAIEPFFVWDWTLNIDNETIHHIVGVAVYCYPKSDTISISNQVLDDDIECYKWVDFKDIKNYNFIPNMLPVINEFIRRYGELI